MRVRRVGRALARSAEGQALVELAIALPLFLLLVVGLVESGRYVYTRLTIRHITAEATRFAVTGNMLEDDDGKRMCRASSVRALVRQQARDFRVALDSVTLDPADGGRPGDVVRVRTATSFRLMSPYADFLPGGRLKLAASSSMRNEPFPVASHEVCD
jgi:Flp pilus assembly protein TadG